jgi:hypothetical protein
MKRREFITLLGGAPGVFNVFGSLAEAARG